MSRGADRFRRNHGSRCRGTTVGSQYFSCYFCLNWIFLRFRKLFLFSRVLRARREAGSPVPSNTEQDAASKRWSESYRFTKSPLSPSFVEILSELMCVFFICIFEFLSAEASETGQLAVVGWWRMWIGKNLGTWFTWVFICAVLHMTIDFSRFWTSRTNTQVT